MTHDTGFLDYWRATRDELDAAFVDWMPRFFEALPEGQAGAVHRALANGKRLRGCLLCLVNAALGGRRVDALPRAVAVECIQAASLIHDDFVDDDAQRRNRPAAWTTYGPRKAVLLGDLMFATALARMVEASRADGLAVAEVIATMATGAWQEPLEPAELEAALFADIERGRHLYPKVIYLKTGALFGTAARLGAFSAGSTPSMADRAFEFGVQLGEAYQIADDLCDLLGNGAAPDQDGTRDRDGARDRDGTPPNVPGSIDGRVERNRGNGRGGSGAGEGECGGGDAGWPDARSTAADPALLAPALLHFCGEAALAAPGTNGLTTPQTSVPSAMLTLLRTRMHQAIDERLAHAADCIRAFPDNAHTHLLRDAPPQIIALMIDR